jgi:hypothetical protein
VPKQIAELALVKSLINQLVNADVLLMFHAHLVKLETHSLANAHVPKQIAELVLVKSLINQIANADALLMLHAHLVKLETHSLANVFAQ